MKTGICKRKQCNYNGKDLGARKEEQAAGIQPGKRGRTSRGRALRGAFSPTLVSMAAKAKEEADLHVLSSSEGKGQLNM